ncbi:MAG TPA: molybdenum ABC transporter ATP-binding protein [Holophaga sp.]|nr:molybdenum ABC transporter ATP-binding protein [Holophaga sp.]
MNRIQAVFELARPPFKLSVDLDLPGWGVTAFFGPSGSGKTTLLRLIAGLDQAPGGRLSVDGETWQDGRTFLPVHRRPLGYVFQDANLFPHLTVRANLEFGRKRMPVSERRVSLDQAVALLDIGHLLSRSPVGLSGGERQRVGIARALAASPRLLLMDEPLASLDLARKREILPYLERLHEDLDIPVLYVSHVPEEVARLADHLVVLGAGRVAASGPIADVLARLDLPIRLGEDAGIVLDGVVAERDDAWHLARIAFPGGSLWARDQGHPVGRSIRVRVLARDVSLALAPPTETSILNILPGTVIEMGEDEHPAQMLVKVRVGLTPFMARLTRRSVAQMGLRPGSTVWVQVKTMAVLG